MVLKWNRSFLLGAGLALSVTTTQAQELCQGRVRPDFGWRFSGSANGFYSFRLKSGGLYTRDYAMYLSQPTVHQPATGSVFQDGDTILTVNGHGATTREAAVILSEYHEGEYRFQVRRRGETVDVAVTPKPVCEHIGLKKGWLGFAVDCDSCKWVMAADGKSLLRFGVPPKVYRTDTFTFGYNAGLRDNDVLIAINGQPIGTDSAASLLARAKPGVPLEFTIRRAGKEVTVRIIPGTPDKSR
jgi:S1-C subfamily serine protease